MLILDVAFISGRVSLDSVYFLVWEVCEGSKHSNSQSECLRHSSKSYFGTFLGKRENAMGRKHFHCVTCHDLRGQKKSCNKAALRNAADCMKSHMVSIDFGRTSVSERIYYTVNMSTWDHMFDVWWCLHNLLFRCVSRSFVNLQGPRRLFLSAAAAPMSILVRDLGGEPAGIPWENYWWSTAHSGPR